MNIRMDQTRRITLGFLLLVVSMAEAATEHATSATLRHLVFVGDSITCGVGVKNRNAERYSAVVTRLLQKKNPSAKRQSDYPPHVRLGEEW